MCNGSQLESTWALCLNDALAHESHEERGDLDGEDRAKGF